MVSQRSIYDLRYSGDGYDQRSAVRVLTAETITLRRAARRALDSLPALGTLTLFDFGYGAGRVTNEFAVAFPHLFGDSGRDLHVIAYDVSVVGLDRAARSLTKEHGFDVREDLRFDRAGRHGYVAGSVGRMAGGTTVTVTFLHGNENDSSSAVLDLVRRANSDRPVALMTSWYSALSHIPGAANRAAFFRMFCETTDPSGEILVAPSVSGDLVELQRYWGDRLLAGDVAGYPIEVQGDVIYRTELSQDNYYHVFGTDLGELLQANVAPGQRGWLEAIRFPDEEFRSRADELVNYRRVRAFNQRIDRRSWAPEDYREVHTAAAIRSGSPCCGAS